MSLLTNVILRGLSNRKRLFEAMLASPVEHQHNVLKKLIAERGQTQFGHDHHFADITDYEDYKTRVPVRAYGDFSSYLALIKQGQQHTLARGMPKYWGRTAGTSGCEKLIPIYPAAIAQSRKTFEIALLLHLAEHPDTRIVGKKLLFLGSSTRLDRDGGLPSGFMSSIMVNEFSFLMRKMILPGNRVNHLPLWQDKIAAILDMTRRADLCIAAAMPPWITAFFHYAVEKTGVSIGDLWPNLSLLLHSGVSVDSYRDDIDQLLGNNWERRRPSFKNGYGATEGNFAIQERDADTSMLLVTDDVFYEFIPIEAYLAGDSQNARIPLEDVKLDIDYVLVLTTPGGLWSYIIGDTIRFASLNPFRICLSGRTSQFLNLAGEKLSVEQALSAIAIAARTTGASVKEFTLFPHKAEVSPGVFSPGHHWLVEFSLPPDSEQKFARVLDDSLREINSLYRIRRQSSFGEVPLMAPPTVTKLRLGTYIQWQREKGRLGGHFKIPRISNSTEFKQELIKGENHGR